MSAYAPGEVVHAIVADVGQYATKMGFAGEDYPRSYFRSTVAVSRNEESDKKGESSKTSRRQPITNVKYDYFTRPIDQKNDTDGKWEVANPVDRTTGLLYDYPASEGEGGADWHDLSKLLLQHGYDSALQTPPENHPLLLVERSYNPPPIRQQMLECLMEEMNVPAAFLARDATLACYGCGRTTGTVVDIGYGSTVVTPVYDGYVEQKGIRRSPMGSLAMDEMISKNLDQLAKRSPFLPLYQVRKFSKRAEAFHSVARLDVARQAREAGAGAAIATTSLEPGFNVPHVPFELPDGQVVNVPSKHRFGVSDLLIGKDEESVSHREEAVAAHQKEMQSIITAASHTDEDGDEGEDEAHKEFYSEAAAVGVTPRRSKQGRGNVAAAAAAKSPVSFSNRHLQRACVSYLQSHLEQLTVSPVPAMVCDAAFRCDRDQQAALLGNVVLAGGGACIGPTDQALPDVLREQVEAIIHTHTPGWRVKVLSPSSQERSILSWLGGSILGSLGTFDKMWISKEEYDEWGPAIVNRKCP